MRNTRTTMPGRCALLAATVMLAGCGGEDTDPRWQVVDQGPRPAPAPAPSAPPTAAVRPSSTAVVVAAALQFSHDERTTSERSTHADVPFGLSYSAGSQTYRVRNEVHEQQFGSAELREDVDAPDFFPRVGYAIESPFAAEFLVLMKAPSATPPIRARFGGHGSWQYSASVQTGFRSRIDYFAFGDATPSDAVPRSGRVRYRFGQTGTCALDDALFFGGMADVVTVDFGTGEVAGAVSVSGRDHLRGATGGVLAANIQGRLYGNRADGELSIYGTPGGRYSVVLLGPAAEEALLVFSATTWRWACVSAGVGVRYP